MERELEVLLAERSITRVIHSYCRGADRRDLELMRQCYWPDGTDDHGSFVGVVDDFIEFVGPALDRFERRNGEWRIAPRVCAYEWRRTDRAVGTGASFADAYVRGQHGEADIIHRIMDAEGSPA